MEEAERLRLAAFESKKTQKSNTTNPNYQAVIDYIRSSSEFDAVACLLDIPQGHQFAGFYILI